MKRRTSVVAIGLLVILLSALAWLAWGGGRVQPPSGPLRLGLNVWPPNEMAYLAQDLGYFTSDEVRLIDYRTGTEAIRAYRDGSIDAVAVTTQQALFLAEVDPNTRVVMVIDASLGGDALVARPEIALLPALRGKAIGQEPSVLGEYMLARVLERAGLKRDQVEQVQLEPDQQVAAYRAGSIDAVVAFEPQRTLLIEAGGRVLFDSSQLEDTLYDVLVVRAQLLKQREADLRKLVRGWLQAVEHYRTRPVEDSKRLASRERLTPAKFRAAMESARLFDRAESQRLFEPGSDLFTSIARQATFMAKAKILARASAGPEAILDARLLSH